MIRILTLSTIFDALKAVKIQIELLDSFMQIITKTSVLLLSSVQMHFSFESCFPFPSLSILVQIQILIIFILEMRIYLSVTKSQIN